MSTTVPEVLERTSSDRAIIDTTISRSVRRRIESWWLPALLLLAALVVRGYRLAASPLWLDELYGFQLGQAGLGTLLRNSTFDPHPPLFYLLQWAGAGFGAMRTEWAWRWLAVASGALTVPLLYVLVATLTSRFTALLTSVVLLVSPAHIYFSQEGRPYALLVLLATLTAWLLVQLEQRPTQRAVWAWLAVLSIVGVWMSYSYTMVVGAQMLYLVVKVRRSSLLAGYLAVVGCACAPFALLAPGTLQQTMIETAHAPPVTPIGLWQLMLAGDSLRYGSGPAHVWMPIIVAGLAAIGLCRLLWRRGTPAVYHALQAVLPPVGFFLVGVPLLHMFLPVFESKQFLVLLPSTLVLFALGIDRLRTGRLGWAGPFVTLALVAGLIYGSAQTLQRYWKTDKSPEGRAALRVERDRQPGDAVLSLHYSTSAALSFYAFGADVYSSPEWTPAGVRFARSASILPDEAGRVPHTTTVEMIRQHPRVWIVSNGPLDAGQQQLTAGCRVVSREVFAPFVDLLVEHCR